MNRRLPVRSPTPCCGAVKPTGHARNSWWLVLGITSRSTNRFRAGSGNDFQRLHAKHRDMKRSFWTIGALAILVAHPAFAQVVPVQPQPAAKPPTSGAPAPKGPAAPAQAGDSTAEGPRAPSSSASTLPSGPQTLPPEDQLDDPMLVAIEEPTHVLADWREALEHVRNRSTNYLIALSQVEAARGQSQMALANSLPKLEANAGISHQLLP